MDRRLSETPQRIVHYKGLICWLYRRGHYEEARAVCQECLKQWPDHWWANAMLAHIDLRRGQGMKAGERLAKWVGQHEDFSHYFLLFHFHDAAGNREEAFKALRKGATLPIQDLHADLSAGENVGKSGRTFLWKAVIIAYRAKNYEVALAICDNWEKRVDELTNLEPAYLALRSACFLAKGDVARAKEQFRLLKEYKTTGRPIADNLESLEKAIEARDRNFAYEPWEGYEPFTLLVEYE
jgi:tetratricopeptide (TPR) repeat protein